MAANVLDVGLVLVDYPWLVDKAISPTSPTVRATEAYCCHIEINIDQYCIFFITISTWSKITINVSFPISS